MTYQERIRIQQAGDAPNLELCLVPFFEKPGAVLPTGIPSPEDVAEAVLNSSDAWWVEFCRAVRKLHQSRQAQLLLAFVARPELTGDVAGGDVDPGFGVDPKDSERLLELRQAIDSYLGWKNQQDEERGDYVFRIREIGDALWNCKAAIAQQDTGLAAHILLGVTKPDKSTNEGPPSPKPSGGFVTFAALQEELDTIDDVLQQYGFDCTRPSQEMHSAFQRLRALEVADSERATKLTEKLRRQRTELKRLNRNERLRAQERNRAERTTDEDMEGVRTAFIEQFGGPAPSIETLKKWFSGFDPGVIPPGLFGKKP